MEQSLTYLKNLSITPKKLRYYLDEVKKMGPNQALDHLFYGSQRATKVLYQALKSAISNAKQTLKVSEDLLKFKLFTVEEGQRLKRYNPGSRGSPKPVLKRKSHIKIILVSKEKKPKLKVEKPAKVEVKAEKKK